MRESLDENLCIIVVEIEAGILDGASKVWGMSLESIDERSLVEVNNDVKVGHAMETACLKYFGLSVDFRGYVTNNDLVRRSVLQRKPLMMQSPDSEIGQDLQRLLGNILQREKVPPS